MCDPDLLHTVGPGAKSGRRRSLMVHRSRLRPTYASVTATLALFIALGGGAYAATALPANSVGPKQIKKNAVERSKLKSNAVDTTKILDNSVTGDDVKESFLDTVPSAETADRATHADSTAALDKVSYRAVAGVAASTDGTGATAGVRFGPAGDRRRREGRRSAQRLASSMASPMAATLRGRGASGPWTTPRWGSPSTRSASASRPSDSAVAARGRGERVLLPHPREPCLPAAHGPPRGGCQASRHAATAASIVSAPRARATDTR